MSAEYIDVSRTKVTSYCQVTEHLEHVQRELMRTISDVNIHLRELIKCGYYNRVSITFRCRIYETILFYQATINELTCLMQESKGDRIQEKIDALEEIAKTADNLNTTLRFSWKTDSYPDDYSEERFLELAQVYKECATMFDMLANVETYVDFLKEYNGK